MKANANDIEKKAKSLKIEIPHLSKPIGSYQPAVRWQNVVFTSGQLAFFDGRIIYPGRVGKEVSLENAQRAAKRATANALASIRWACQSLNYIEQIIKLEGYVLSAVGFQDQAKVINAASEMLLDLFGPQKGAHARVSVGCLELPQNASVEISLTVGLKSLK